MAIDYTGLDNESNSMLNTLRSKIASETLDSMIEEKLNQYHYLVPVRNIIRILYFECIQKDSVTKIRDIMPGIYFVSLLGKVTYIFPPKTLTNETGGQYTRYMFNIEDATGKTIVIFYDHELFKDIILNSIISIKRGLCKYSKVYLNKTSELKILKNPVFSTILQMKNKKQGRFFLKSTVVSELDEVPYLINNKTRHILTFKIADETGAVVATVWKKEYAVFPKQGCKIRLENIKYYNNEVHIDNDSRVCIIHCPSDPDEMIVELSDIFVQNNQITAVFGNRNVQIPHKFVHELIAIDTFPKDINITTLIQLKKKELLGRSFSLCFDKNDNNLISLKNI